jgi:hypothetical protein
MNGQAGAESLAAGWCVVLALREPFLGCCLLMRWTWLHNRYAAILACCLSVQHTWEGENSAEPRDELTSYNAVHTPQALYIVWKDEVVGCASQLVGVEAVLSAMRMKRVLGEGLRPPGSGAAEDVVSSLGLCQAGFCPPGDQIARLLPPFDWAR